MKKLYCSGKSGFCPNYDGEVLPDCFLFNCENQGNNEYRIIEQQTNYDRIRNMCVDELAKFIPDWSYTKACKCDEEIYANCNNECWKCVKEWLESEVDTE